MKTAVTGLNAVARAGPRASHRAWNRWVPVPGRDAPRGVFGDAARHMGITVGIGASRMLASGAALAVPAGAIAAQRRRG